MINKVVLLGRVVRNPEVRYSQGDNPICICRYTLAVPRKYRKEGEPDADFINCIAFGKLAEFAEKYFVSGKRYCIAGHLQTGSYTNKDGKTVYYTEVVVEEQDFADNADNAGNGNGNAGGGSQQKSGNQRQGQNNNQQSGGNKASGARQQNQQPAGDGFMDVPDGIDEELPFN